jgi:hypothetical protein
MLSELRRFKFTLSWLCDDHIAADTVVLNGFRQRAMTAPSTRFEGPPFSKIDLILIACRELVGDLGWGRLSTQGADERVE